MLTTMDSPPSSCSSTAAVTQPGTCNSPPSSTTEQQREALSSPKQESYCAKRLSTEKYGNRHQPYPESSVRSPGSCSSDGDSIQSDSEDPTRTLPLKVKRVAANSRERKRMHTVNSAFDQLRELVPTYPSNRKLSKIDTLRLACTYIQDLVSLLHNTQTIQGEDVLYHQPPFPESFNGYPVTVKQEMADYPAYGTSEHFRMQQACLRFATVSFDHYSKAHHVAQPRGREGEGGLKSNGNIPQPHSRVQFPTSIAWCRNKHQDTFIYLLCLPIQDCPESFTGSTSESDSCTHSPPQQPFMQCLPPSSIAVCPPPLTRASSEGTATSIHTRMAEASISSNNMVITSGTSLPRPQSSVAAPSPVPSPPIYQRQVNITSPLAMHSVQHNLAAPNLLHASLSHHTVPPVWNRTTNVPSTYALYGQ